MQRGSTLLELGIAQPSDPFEGQGCQPTQARVLRAINKLKDGKAIGPDCISAELMKAGGQPCALMLWDLLCKVWAYAYWPLDWRGGRLQELIKKGSPRLCDNHRGLLISDHIGKAASSVLYDAVDEGYHGYVPESQCGAVKGKSGDFATHLLRSALDYAKARSLSIAILFVDLVKAFDRLLREIVIGWPQAGAAAEG